MTTILLLIELVTTMFAVQFRDSFDVYFHRAMNDWLFVYHKDSDSKSIVDTIQWTFRCCANGNVSLATCCDHSFEIRGLTCNDRQQFKADCSQAIQRSLHE